MKQQNFLQALDCWNTNDSSPFKNTYSVGIPSSCNAHPTKRLTFAFKADSTEKSFGERGGASCRNGMEQGIASDNRQKQTLKLIFRNNKIPKAMQQPVGDLRSIKVNTEAVG